MTLEPIRAEVPNRTCYVAASEDIRSTEVADSIRLILAELHIGMTGPEAIDSLPRAAGAGPARPDFGVFILTRVLTSILVYEIGLLVGARKPVLLITVDEVDLPLPLRELPQLAWPLSPDALAFQLWAFVRSQVPLRKLRSGKGRQLPPSPAELQPELIREQETRQSGWAQWQAGTHLERETAKALASAPFKVAPMFSLLPEEARHDWADAGLWVPEIGPMNPVVLELKSTHKADSTEAIHQLARLIQGAGLHLGLLIFPDDLEDPRTILVDDVAIVRAPVRLLQDLSPEGELRGALRRARNRLVHGKVD